MAQWADLMIRILALRRTELLAANLPGIKICNAAGRTSL